MESLFMGPTHVKGEAYPSIWLNGGIIGGWRHKIESNKLLVTINLLRTATTTNTTTNTTSNTTTITTTSNTCVASGLGSGSSDSGSSGSGCSYSTSEIREGIEACIQKLAVIMCDIPDPDTKPNTKRNSNTKQTVTSGGNGTDIGTGVECDYDVHNYYSIEYIEH